MVDVLRLMTMAVSTGSLTALLGVADLASADSIKPKAVVELFTSQGCSSCPPADALIGELAKRKDVIVLTLPVDYWDYLGWKDTFGSAAFSDRQRAYAMKRGDGEVYTPQVVVNGLAHAVGSKKVAVEQAIDDTFTKLSASQALVTAEPVGGDLKVNVSGGTKGAKATLWLAKVITNAPVAIGRGENGGLAATYYNVVRELKPVGPWHGVNVSFIIHASELKDPDCDAYVLLLQADEFGEMLGGFEIARWTQ